jgi:hypothetical protein
VNFLELIDANPSALDGRRDLTFEAAPPADIVAALNRSGVVMLRSVLPPLTLRRCHTSFQRFAATLGRPRTAAPHGLAADQAPEPMWDNGELPFGSWHHPWVVRDGNHSPAAAVIKALLRSWAWPVVEELCGSTDLVILLGQCTTRHSIDGTYGVGGHQDAKVVSPDIPFSIWIPLHEVAPAKTSGIGFVVPAPDGLLDCGDNGDVGSAPIEGAGDALWIPRYGVGDLTIHTNRSLHFTTFYGTGTHRYSLEIRAMAVRDVRDKPDPALYVSRPGPAIVDVHYSPNLQAKGFLGSFAVR